MPSSTSRTATVETEYTPRSTLWTNIALTIIALGALLGLNIVTWPLSEANWWANFVFLPAHILLLVAVSFQPSPPWRLFTQALALNGAVLLGFCAVLLLIDHINVGWPLLVIAAGGLVALPSLVLHRSSLPLLARSWARSGVWTGIIIVVSGWVFQMINMALISVPSIIVNFEWWAIIIAVLGAGLLESGWWLSRREARNTLGVHILALTGLGVLFYALIEMTLLP